MFAVQSLAIPSEKIREDRFNSWMGIQTGFKIGIHYTTAHFSCIANLIPPCSLRYAYSNLAITKRRDTNCIKKG